MKAFRIIAAATLLASSWLASEACSRVVYQGSTGIVLVGRTLDWRTPIPTNIYVYPAGIEKESMNSGSRLRWTSKYGSVVATGYDSGVTEGMNEAGLVMNGLFCKGSIYTSVPEDNPTMPQMSLAMIVPYFIDNFATVAEVKRFLESTPFAIAGSTFDGGTVTALHWAITDKTGETLLMEYQGGKLNTYSGMDLTVLTNDPPMPQMRAIEDYWEKVGGVNMLPGTVRSSDRFVRASFFINHVPKDFKYAEALGSLESIMGTVSVPYGYEIEGEPNVSSTQWRSVSDGPGGKYYMHYAATTGDIYVDLGRLQLSPGAPILKYDSARYMGSTGCVNDLLEVSKGFTPMW